jgi:hypothetical protein
LLSRNWGSNQGRESTAWVNQNDMLKLEVSRLCSVEVLEPLADAFAPKRPNEAPPSAPHELPSLWAYVSTMDSLNSNLVHPSVVSANAAGMREVQRNCRVEVGSVMMLS